MKIFLFLMIVFLAASTSIFAQSGKKKSDSTQLQTYTCPMHPEVNTHQPGNCPKCGMMLVTVKKNNATVYSCPMHPEVTSTKPGQCPKCGMDLVEKMGGHHMDTSMNKMPM